MAEFSLLEPGTIVRPHTGRSNTRLRIHLPLSEPADGEAQLLGIEVGGETRRWQAGIGIAFDDSFVHRVWHNGSTPRLVLIVDIWHPSLSSWEERWRSIDIKGRRERFEALAAREGVETRGWEEGDEAGLALQLNDAAALFPESTQGQAR